MTRYSAPPAIDTSMNFVSPGSGRGMESGSAATGMPTAVMISIFLLSNQEWNPCCFGFTSIILISPLLVIVVLPDE